MENILYILTYLMYLAFATLMFPGVAFMWMVWRVVRRNSVMAIPSIIDVEKVKKLAKKKAEDQLATILEKGGEQDV